MIKLSTTTMRNAAPLFCLMWLVAPQTLGLSRPGVPGRRGPQCLASHPNIVVILADDAGYGDFGCYGSCQILTPRIDGLARGGVRFTSGYMSASVCSPSRAGLLTGRYQQRFGHEDNIPAQPQPGDSLEFMGLPTGERTLADHLRDLGYQTGAIGKWHLGMAEQFHPLRRGFEEFFGFLGGSSHYFPEQQKAIWRNREHVPPQAYLTDAFGREACAFIERHRDRPFFLYLAFNAVHTPMDAKADQEERFAALTKEKRRKLAAMTWALDQQVGAVVDTLKSLNLDENTLVFFLNDNGGNVGYNAACNAPLNGKKGTLFEGGVRVPFIMRWPGHLPVGRVYDRPVSALDVSATALSVAGGSLPEKPVHDGVNLLPFITGERSGRPHQTLYWRRGPFAAIRDGDWKLIRMPDRPAMLFDLANDLSEQHDLAAERPDQVRALMKKLFDWETGLIHPVWRTAPYWIRFNVKNYDRTYDLEQPGTQDG